ncbi:hypothetical protein N7470_010235 [Penicillium chermesinum]|nr:hypothetical protein N7470_010235 [Penicillium chermesinum]
MPQDEPADTAGPSSPPPRLPEGWLPQWEGVQRKWYYVQRATGKSQWEIPTEPVILTPSTTPTSIGTGPSQAPPSRPSTNSPQVSLVRKTLAEKIEAAVEKSRASSSLDAQLNEHSGNPISGPSGATNWYPGNTGHNIGPGFPPEMGLGGGGYVPSLHPESSLGNHLADSAAYYPSHHQTHNANHLASPWSHVPNPHAQPAGGYMQQNEQHQGPFRGNPADPLQSRYISEFPPSHLTSGHSQILGIGAQVPQPQWQLEQKNYPASSDHALRPSQASNAAFHAAEFGIKQGLSQAPRESYSTSQLANSTNQHHPSGIPMSRSHSYQSSNGFPREGASAYGAIGDRPYNGYPTQTVTPQTQYPAMHMARTESGTGFSSMVFPRTSDSHGAHYYQDPIIQTGIHQYAPPKPQQGHVTHANDFSGVVYPSTEDHMEQQHEPPGTGPSRPRTASSHPQFVSGPWASSTPPQPAQQPQARYDRAGFLHV